MRLWIQSRWTITNSEPTARADGAQAPFAGRRNQFSTPFLPVGARLTPPSTVAPLRLTLAPGGATLVLLPPLPAAGARWPGEHDEDGAGTIVGWDLEACKDTTLAVLVRAAPAVAVAAAAATAAPWRPVILLALLGRDRPIVCTEGVGSKMCFVWRTDNNQNAA